MNRPLPLWKIVLLWLTVGAGCVVWTYTGEPAKTPNAGVYRT